MKFPDSVIGVIATATIPTIDALRRIARTLSTLRKLGVRATATMTATATAPSTSAVESRSARPASRRASGASAATAPRGRRLRHAASSAAERCMTSRATSSSVRSSCGAIEVSRPR